MRQKTPTTATAARPRLLRLPEVSELIGLGKSAIYAAMAQPDQTGQRFPTPVRIGCRAVAWREHEVLAWIESRTKTRGAL